MTIFDGSKKNQAILDGTDTSSRLYRCMAMYVQDYRNAQAAWQWFLEQHPTPAQPYSATEPRNLVIETLDAAVTKAAGNLNANYGFYMERQKQTNKEV